MSIDLENNLSEEESIPKKENREGNGEGSKTVIYTTGQVASICEGYISKQKILRCFDNGDLKGFLVPESRHRRIPRDNLIEWLKKYKVYDRLKDRLEE